MKNTTLHVAGSSQRDVEPTRRFPLLKELMATVCGPKMYNPPRCVARRRQIMTIVCGKIYNLMTMVCGQITNVSSCVAPQPMYHVISCIYNMLECSDYF